MIKVKKDGITKHIVEKDLQKFKDMGFEKVEAKPHKQEPMVIEEPKEEEKPKAKKAEKAE